MGRVACPVGLQVKRDARVAIASTPTTTQGRIPARPARLDPVLITLQANWARLFAPVISGTTPRMNASDLPRWNQRPKDVPVRFEILNSRWLRDALDACSHA
jgi:hypothetical protein